MNEIKFIRHIKSRNHESVQPLPANRERHFMSMKKSQIESLEPWNEDAQKNPFLLFKSDIYKKNQNIVIKKRIGSIIAPPRNWKTVERNISQRELKKLPIMDIGQFNELRKNNTPNVRSKLDLNIFNKQKPIKATNPELTLPSVQRSLQIQRKIFLMKNLDINEYKTLSSRQKRIQIKSDNK